MDTLPVAVRLDFRSGIPIYVQVSDQIRQMVAAGLLKPDDQLPTVRQLAAELRVNYNTIARAYRLLDEAGLISTQQGRGTYIWARPDEESGRKINMAGLEELMRQYLEKIRKQGYSTEEIREAFQQQVDRWEA